VWTVGGALLDAASQGSVTVALSGSGLQTPRTISVRNGDAAKTENWQVETAYRDRARAALGGLAPARAEAPFWKIQLPIALVIAALTLAAFAGRSLARLRRGAQDRFAAPASRANSSSKGTPHVAH
jgi:high-affinity iron transporter